MHFYIVATVRFEEPEYTFQEDSGTGEVCLIKDLATPDSVTVQVPTTDITATGKPHPCTYTQFLFRYLYQVLNVWIRIV